MDTPADGLQKRREIALIALHPDPEPAASAAALLQQVAGIQRVEVIDGCVVEVRYQLLAICLAEIETCLEQHGMHLDNRLVHKIRRALHHYTESTQRANLGCPRGDANCTQKVFVNRYRNRGHGCRDDRPAHWRRYL